MNLRVGLEVGAQSAASRVPQVQDRQATWVRLNFINFPGTDWTDAALLAQYDVIVDAYFAAGITVLGLIGAESVAGGYDRNNPGAFTAPLATEAGRILDHFGNRVKFFEVFNEPNDWLGGTSAQVPAADFAHFLEAVYQTQIALINAGQAHVRDVMLLSGPLFSHDADTAADYLNATIQHGVANHNWGPHDHYPFGGSSYHIYVTQGPSPVSAIDVVSGIQKNLAAVRNILQHFKAENIIYVTEFGWQTGAGFLTAANQADALEVAYDTFAADPSVRVAMWFSIQDSIAGDWGLLDGTNNPKPSWNRFRKMALKFP